MMLVIITGAMSALFAAITVDLRSRDYLIGRAQTVANALPTESIAFLEANETDLDKFEYKELKERLERIKADNRDLDFVYLTKKHNDQAVFLVDSTLDGSPEHFDPGEVNPEVSPRLLAGLGSTKAFIEGPAKNSRGTWITALAPVIDPATNQTIAMVGIDTPAFDYYAQIAVYALVPLTLAAIPLAGLIRDRKLQDKEWQITELKNQFVSIASHELRSPLSGMLWAIQSMLKSDTNLNAEQKALLQDMFKSAESSTATINEILDLSVFERGQADKMQSETIELVSAVKDVQKTLSLGAKEKNLTINFDDSVPETAYSQGDLSAIKRSFMNLVSNSIKYTFENSTIDIGYELKENQHIFSIKDHGIGIPKEEQDKVLGGYYRAANATKVQAHGTGLGLWITRLIIEEHGGSLRLESEENKGTTMFVSLPANLRTATKPL